MRLVRPFFSLALAAAFPAAAIAYTPGSGTLFTENFDAQLDEGWEQGNGFASPSPWKQVLDGPDKAFQADGAGPFPGSPSLHWARHAVHPVEASSFSIAFEYRGDQGTGYAFDLEVEQRAPSARKLRLRIGPDGAVSLWRTETGAFVQIASTLPGEVPAGQNRWVRFGLEPDPSGHRRVGVRVWTGGAGAEPASGWTLAFVDDLDVVDRIHRFELLADGPIGVLTWIDDLDAWGDEGAGVDSSVRTIWVVELSHLDIGFTEPPDDIEAFAKTHLDQVLDNLDLVPEYRWTIESAWWLDRWWERSNPTERQRMLDALTEGRLSLGAGYANLHTTTASHEGLTRNVYWASRFARQCSVPVRTWFTDDVPGSTFALPEVLDRSGIDYYVGGMNTSFGIRTAVPNHATRPFWWRGPDGSRVLSWITHDSYAEGFDYGFSFFDTLADLYGKLGTKLPEQEEAGYPYADLMLLRGFDNHYQGLHVRNLVNQWNATYATPVFRLATPEEFLDHMVTLHGAGSFPELAGDFGAAWSASHANAPHTERLVRQAHREGRDAEALVAAGSSIDGAPPPIADLDFLYRRILEVDEHSGPGGWPGLFTQEEMDRNNSIHVGYAQDAASTAAALLDQGLDRTLAEVSASGDALAVVNPLGRARDAWVRVALPPDVYAGDFRIVDRATAQEEPFQRFPASSEILFRSRDVPSFGYRVYDLAAGPPTAGPPGDLLVTGTSLENAYYVVQIDAADGSIASIRDKVRGREIVDAASAWDFNELASNTKNETLGPTPPTGWEPISATVAVETAGPLLAELRVTRTGTPHVESIYRLHSETDRVEVENVLDRDAMPFVPEATGSVSYTVTMPFDVHDFRIRRETPTRYSDPPADVFDPANDVFDWHNVEHTLAFWDDGGGVLYACDAVDSHHFEALKSFPSNDFGRGDALLLSRLVDKSDEYEFEGGTIGTFETEPGMPPLYRSVHHIRATGPVFDPVAASRFGFEALSPVRTRVLSRRPGNLPPDRAAFFEIEPEGILAYTVKPADDADGVVLRMTELTGAHTIARVGSEVLAFALPERVEQDEDGGVPLSLDLGDVVVPMEGFETATVRVRTAPAWSPIGLTVAKDAVTGDVVLDWSGGVSPYTVERSENPWFPAPVTRPVDEQPGNSYRDPVLNDGITYYYLVR